MISEFRFCVTMALPGSRATWDGIRTAPGVLVGTPQQIADRVRECRDRGDTYFTMMEPDMEAFAPVTELLK
ncbi:hypothetical protein ACIA8C_09290 [Nocardia sp. NPDC051321]|uniref:hypothetical protein n=1 Tax=Nocardia sp. NPDC051321 TaxID=3364323 RepID=UPI0037BC06E9